MTTKTYTTKTTPPITFTLKEEHTMYGFGEVVRAADISTGDLVMVGVISKNRSEYLDNYTWRCADVREEGGSDNFVDAINSLWAKTTERNEHKFRLITDVTYAQELQRKHEENKALMAARREAARIAHEEAVSKFVEPTWNGKWFTQNQAKARVTDGLKQIKDLPSRRKIEIGSRTYQQQWCFAGTTDEMLDWYNGDYMENVINACDDLDGHDTVSGSFCGTNKDMRRQGSFVHVYIYEWDDDWSLYDVHVIWLGTETEPAKHVGR